MIRLLTALLLFFYVWEVALSNVVGVRHLVGEPDYRAVRLKWEAFSRDGDSILPRFNVRYCELQSWGTQRCRNHEVSEPETNELHPLPEGNSNSDDNSRSYAADVEGLRMATTYSFEIRPVDARREDRADDSINDNVIVIPTKGFSARATQCLPHASEIEVSTGPYFAGRITVEASDGDRCTVDGEADSPRDTYLLHIDHKLCGSQVNETTVATYVIVQENLPILTHSTRRFLVLCTYQPETLTVRAGLSLPSVNAHHHDHGHGQSAPVPSEQDFNSVRRSRQLRPARLEAAQENPPNKGVSDNVAPVTLFSLLVIIGVSCIIIITLRWRRTTVVTNTDTESIGSEISAATDIDDSLSQRDSSLPVMQSNPLYNCESAVEVLAEIPRNKTETVC